MKQTLAELNDVVGNRDSSYTWGYTEVIQRRPIGSRAESAWETIKEDVDVFNGSESQAYAEHPYDLSTYEYRIGEAPERPRMVLSKTKLAKGEPRVDFYDEDGSYLSHRSLRYVHALYAQMVKHKKNGTFRDYDFETEVPDSNGTAGSFRVVFHENGNVEVGCQSYTFEEVTEFVKANPLPKTKLGSKAKAVAGALARR